MNPLASNAVKFGHPDKNLENPFSMEITGTPAFAFKQNDVTVNILGNVAKL
jgi:hypothetical protein